MDKKKDSLRLFDMNLYKAFLRIRELVRPAKSPLLTRLMSATRSDMSLLIQFLLLLMKATYSYSSQTEDDSRLHLPGCKRFSVPHLSFFPPSMLVQRRLTDAILFYNSYYKAWDSDLGSKHSHPPGSHSDSVNSNKLRSRPQSRPKLCPVIRGRATRYTFKGLD